MLILLLRRRGRGAGLRIGVGREGGSLAAHAWVVCGGRVVGEEPGVAGRFAATLAWERRA